MPNARRSFSGLPNNPTEEISQVSHPISKGAKHIAEQITSDLLRSFPTVLDDMKPDLERIVALDAERDRR